VIRFGKYGRKLWKDLENTEENYEMIGKIWKKGKLNSEKIWKIQKKIVKRFGNTEENCEKIWKIWKKIVKWFGKYGKK
jgi:hypothetical protein